jgi:acyl-CoA reductase-like NAD-dependent aldehyde dehydrogenase
MFCALLQIFGPVQSIFKFKDVDDVIEQANDTTYGLAAAVLTKDINTAITVANSLEAGTVWFVLVIAKLYTFKFTTGNVLVLFQGEHSCS